MLRAVPVFFVFVLTLSAMSAQARTDSTGQAKARELADSFVADVMANRNQAALAKWERPNRDFDQFLKTTIDMCGAPIDSTPQNNGAPEVGDSVGRDGKTKPTFTFLYECKPGKDSRRSFSVAVQTADQGERYVVASIGCQTVDDKKSKTNTH